METLAASTVDLESQAVSDCPMDTVELTDEDLEQVAGSWGCWGCGWGGGFWPSWGWGGFSPFWGWGFSPGWGWGNGFGFW
jgi:hypothetical protein